MQDSNSPEVSIPIEEYTRTAAYNLLKKKIGVKKNVKIYHRLFELAFTEIRSGEYLINCSEEEMERILKKIEIQKRNEECYQMKKAGRNSEVQEISKATVRDFAQELSLVA